MKVKLWVHDVLVIVTKHKQQCHGCLNHKSAAKTHKELLQEGREIDTVRVGLGWWMRSARNNRQRSHSRCTHAQLTHGASGRLHSYPSVCVFDGLLRNMGSFPSVTHAFLAYEYLRISSISVA